MSAAPPQGGLTQALGPTTGRTVRLMKKLLTFAALLSIGGCNVQHVDVAQPVAVADKFYKALKSGDGKAALAQFAPEFKSQVDNWPRLLGRLQEKHGHVTAADLQDSSLAANDDGPCYSLVYAVQRGSLASNETLFLCAKDGTSTWFIRGHKLTRLDTKQTVTGGVLPSEVGVHVP